MLGTIFTWLLGILIAVFVVLTFWGRRMLTDRRSPDEIRFLQAADGWDLALWHIKPKTLKAKKIPVLLQHGLGFNQRNFDLEDGLSVAHYLAAQGYDCWLPALRGCGPSKYRRWGYPNRWNIRFEDFVEKDLPAFLDEIGKRTGAKQVHYIGHSMGGMIGYALAEGEQAKRLKSLTSIAGPCFFNHMTQFKAMARFKALIKPFPAVQQTVIMRYVAPLTYLWPGIIGKMIFYPANVHGSTTARAAINGIEDNPATLLLQFARWVETGCFGAGHSEPWQEHLHKIKTPIYCIAGTRDFFCPETVIEPVVQQVGSRRKQYRVFSRANGESTDYGHGDLVSGIAAPAEVYPTLLAWLRENDNSR